MSFFLTAHVLVAINLRTTNGAKRYLAMGASQSTFEEKKSSLWIEPPAAASVAVTIVVTCIP